MRKILLTTILLLIILGDIIAQQRFEKLEAKLEALSKTNPGLKEKVDLSFSQVSIQEFTRALASANELNITIDPGIEFRVVNNFKNITAKEVLVFLCKRYSLTLNFTGNIISIEPFSDYKLRIHYLPENDLLSLNLRNDTLYSVTKKITKLSGKNVILSPGLHREKVTVYVEKLPFLTGLEKMAYANNLEVEQSEDNVFVLKKKQGEVKGMNARNQPYGSRGQGSRQQAGDESGMLEYHVNPDSTITIYAVDAPIMDIINEVSKATKRDYFIQSKIDEITTTNLKGVEYDELLDNILSGTQYTYKKAGNIYIVGDRKLEGLRESKLVRLRHRSVIELVEVIPESLQESIIVKEFPDLNGFLLSGSAPGIAELESFIKEIDQPVPVIQIEVLIVDHNRNFQVSTGMEAGLGEEPVVTGGKLYPSLDMTLSSSTINEMLNSFNGWGMVNIGQVTPNFYMTLSAMEDQGIVKIRSTPKLSTLNGHEAELKIGKTEYYKEEISNFNYNQSTQQTVTSRYQSVTADLSITVIPIVSNDDQITLEVKIEQSDFTSRISKEAPPGKISRSFNSNIRVKNGEMILLGGLEEKKTNDTGSGVPFLSRIPILKWLFSSRSKTDSRSRLNIFIKPLIIN